MFEEDSLEYCFLKRLSSFFEGCLAGEKSPYPLCPLIFFNNDALMEIEMFSSSGSSITALSAL